MGALKPIDRRAVTDVVFSDLEKAIGLHPDAFDALLYRAILEPLSDSDGPDVVGSFEERENPITYGSPERVRAVELPGELSGRRMLADGLSSLDEQEEPVVMLIHAQGIPEQSVLWIDECMPDGKLKVTTLYVLKSEPIGKNGAGGVKHHMLSFRGDWIAGPRRPEQEKPKEGATHERGSATGRW